MPTLTWGAGTVNRPTQCALCYPCGRTDVLALGLCEPCYTLRRQDEEYFGGLREQVLRRDGCHCRECDGLKPGVHHRVPGVSKLHLIIALCDMLRYIERRGCGAL